MTATITHLAASQKTQPSLPSPPPATGGADYWREKAFDSEMRANQLPARPGAHHRAKRDAVAAG
jgi:hypothetical protein